MGGDCENLVNNSLLFVNKSLGVQRQRIFKTFFHSQKKFCVLPDHAESISTARSTISAGSASRPAPS
jgi:hypothetical protein